jgi:hypothetical protein
MNKVPLREDKFMRGIIAGAIGGLVKDIPSIIIHVAHSDVYPTYWDYSGMIGMGVVPEKIPEITVAIFIQLIFSIAMGIFIVYASSYIKSHHYLIKGAFLGGSTWFLIRASVWGAQIKDFNKPQVLAFMINSTTSIVFGLLVAYIDKRIQKGK